VFVNDLLRTAKRSLVLIDNYVDDSVLVQLAKRREGVSAAIFTKRISKQLSLDLKKHNAQYPPIMIGQLSESHDRFLIVDGDAVYHIGASLKDLGKKWFAFSKMDKSGLKVMEKNRRISQDSAEVRLMTVTTLNNWSARVPAGI
jgi:TPP-dependent 2-oxoacid decarboxylase